MPQGPLAMRQRGVLNLADTWIEGDPPLNLNSGTFWRWGVGRGREESSPPVMEQLPPNRLAACLLDSVPLAISSPAATDLPGKRESSSAEEGNRCPKIRERLPIFKNEILNEAKEGDHTFRYPNQDSLGSKQGH